MKKGWQIKRFDEVLEIRNGKNQREVESASGEFPIYGSAGNVMGMATSYICEAGTTIIGRKGNINSPIYTGTRFWNVDTAFGLSAKSGLDSKFLYFFCLSHDFSVYNRGTTIPSLVKSELLQIPIPIPSLPEQKRIVAVLDKAFAAIAKAKENAEKNLANAESLFKSHLAAVFDQHSGGWPMKKLGELSVLITDGTHNSPPYVETGIPMLDSKHVGDDFVIDDSKPEKFISSETDVLLAKRCKPRAGDILISSRGSIGKIAIVKEGQDFNIMGNMILIRLPAGIDREFAAFYLHSRVAHIESIARGVAQKGLYLNQIREYELPLPPNPRQASIGIQLREVLANTQQLKSICHKKLDNLEELKRSILQKAFSGELVGANS